MTKIFKPLTLFAVIFSAHCFGQKETTDIEIEGRKLYRSEMASWYGTDVFLAKFPEKKANSGGYFSYSQYDKSICIFFSKDPVPKVLATIVFDSTYNVNSAGVDGQDRELTPTESDLLKIRKVALAEITSDTLFRKYKNTSLNIVPLNDENGKRVYVLTGPQTQGVVIFGNDYLLSFDGENNLLKKSALHKNIISTEYESKDGKIVFGAMHTHLPSTGDVITATDICTLMLYEKYAKWKQYYVMSENYVSIWNCDTDMLVLMTKKAWDKINMDQKAKN